MSPDAEQMLADLPDPGSEQVAASDPAGIDVMAAMVPKASNPFKQEYVQDVLEELFAWLAGYFAAEHWLLTDRQSRMLSEPTTELMGSLWQHLQRLLPQILERWAESTPGLVDAVFAFGIVLTPKCLQQISISRERRATGKPTKNVGPIPITSQPGTGTPVAPMTGDIEPLPDVEVS